MYVRFVSKELSRLEALSGNFLKGSFSGLFTFLKEAT